MFAEAHNFPQMTFLMKNDWTYGIFYIPYMVKISMCPQTFRQPYWLKGPLVQPRRASWFGRQAKSQVSSPPCAIRTLEKIACLIFQRPQNKQLKLTIVFGCNSGVLENLKKYNQQLYKHFIETFIKRLNVFSTCSAIISTDPKICG